MRLNKSYLIGFGVFAITAGLYGIVAFQSYAQLQRSKTDAQPSGQAAVSAAQVEPTVQPSLEPNTSPSASLNSDSTAASQLSGSPNSAGKLPEKLHDEKPVGKASLNQDRTDISGKPQAQMGIPDVRDETNQISTGDVYGPADSTLKMMPQKRKTSMRQKMAKPISDEVASDFDVIASADAAINNESQADTRESWLKSLGISMKQYRVIQQREDRLAKEVKEVEKDGADGSKDLLVTEYQEWLREYLGPDRYVRFSELASAK